MLNSEEREIIFQNAYIPEHLEEYVCSISEGEPFFYKGYLYFLRKNHMIFIGYPLNKPFKQTEANDILIELVLKHRIKSIASISETKLNVKGDILFESSDYYYMLDISSLSINKKLKSCINRAIKEITVEISRNLTPEHNKIIDEYLRMEKFDNYTRYIFTKIPDYIFKSKTSLLLNAKARDGSLVGFNVLDLGSLRYAFYMFNFISRKLYIPGASDLLMYEMIKIAKQKGKEFINLGLGINKGVTFFKKKWNGKIFLNYQFTHKIIDRNSTIDKILSVIRQYF